MKMQKAPQLATSATGKVNGTGSAISDNIPAMVSPDEAILNAGAAAAFQKLTGMSINDYNAIYAPKGAETKMVDGVIHAAAGIGNTEEDRLSQEMANKLTVNELYGSPDATVANQGVLGYVGENVGRGVASIGRGIGNVGDAATTLTSGAMEGTGKLLYGNDNKPAFGMDNVAPTLAPTTKPETPTPQQQPAATAKLEVPPIVTPVNTTQPQTVGANAAKITDTKQTAIPTELPIPLAGSFTKTKDDDVGNVIKHNVGGKTIYSDSMTAPQLPKPSIKPQAVNNMSVPTGQSQTNEGVPAEGIVQSQAATPIAQTNAQRLASAEADSRDLSQRQTANDAPNHGAGKYATPAQIAAAGQTGTPQPRAVNVNGGRTGAGSGEIRYDGDAGGDGGVTLPATQAPSIATPVQRNTTAPVSTGTQQAAPQLSQVFQPRDDSMVSLPRDVTQSATGGSTPQERFAIQQAQLQQPPQLAQQRQVITQAPQLEGVISDENKQAMNNRLASAYSVLNDPSSDHIQKKFAQKDIDAVMGYDTADRGGQQKAIDSAQGGDEFTRGQAQQQKQFDTTASQHILDQNVAQNNVNRSAAAATATAAQAQQNWVKEHALKLSADDKPMDFFTPQFNDDGTPLMNESTGAQQQLRETMRPSERAQQQYQTHYNNYLKVMNSSASPEQKATATARAKAAGLISKEAGAA